MNPLNKFIHEVINAFHPELPSPKPSAKIILNTKDFAMAVCRTMENKNYFIRENTYPDNTVTYWVMENN